MVIDNYIDETVLMQLSKRRAGVKVDLYDGKINDQIRLDVKRLNKQYPGVTLHVIQKLTTAF